MGLNINKDKFALYGSRLNNLTDVYQALKIDVKSLAFKNLGLSLVVGNLCLIHFNHFIDKLYCWLEGWKSKLLSLGGRL